LLEEAKPCKHVVKKEDVEDKVEALEDVLEEKVENLEEKIENLEEKVGCIVEDVRTVVVDGLKKVESKVKTANKETLIAGGFVGAILVLGLVKKLIRK
jgi:ElaB/YqjD/DUF883 family membrane-anchored ribosome-binding protein